MCIRDRLTALLPELGFVVADGFAVALGFDAVQPVVLLGSGLRVVLFSVLDVADELLRFELSVLLLSVFAHGVAVGFALAVLALAVGLLVASFFSDTVLLTALGVELSEMCIRDRIETYGAAGYVAVAVLVRFEHCRTAVVFYVGFDRILNSRGIGFNSSFKCCTKYVGLVIPVVCIKCICFCLLYTSTIDYAMCEAEEVVVIQTLLL